MAIIACKECGHQVSDQAASCPNCGAPIAAHAEPKPKINAKRVLYGGLITLAVLCVIAAAVWIAAPHQLVAMIGAFDHIAAHPRAIDIAAPAASAPVALAPVARPAPMAPTRLVYQTTAEQLYQDYSANAVATQSKIGHSRIRISGSVAEIVEDASGHPIVKLWTSNDDSAGMMLNDDQKAPAAQLVKGEKVDVECDKIRPSETQHRLASPQGSGCELVLVDDASTQQAYLALFFSADRGIAPLYVVGPMSKDACVTRSDGISAQLRASLKRDQVVSKNCAPTARESVPAEGCRLSASMSAVPDMPAAHLWRYDCAAPAAGSSRTVTVKATGARKSRQSVAANPVVPPPDLTVEDVGVEPSPETTPAPPAPSQSSGSNAAPPAPATAPATPAVVATAPLVTAAAVTAAAPAAAPAAAAATPIMAATAPVSTTPATAAAPAPAATAPAGAVPAVAVAAPVTVATAAAAPIAAAASSTVVGAAPEAGASTPNAAAIPADLLTVKASDPGAAEHIASYCTTATAAASDPTTVAAGCRHDEAAAWNRLVLHNEFPTLDDTTRRKCSEPPFPDSYVAKESCAKYLLRSNELSAR